MLRIRAPQKNKYLNFLDEIPAMVKLRIKIIIKTKKEITWDINKVVAVDTAGAEDRAVDRRKCTRRFAQTARKNALSRLSQAETVRFTARNASQSVKIPGVNEQRLTFVRINKADCW